MYLVCLVFLALSILAALGVRKARSGRVVIADARQPACRRRGRVPTTSVKLSAFLLAGFIAGVAGAPARACCSTRWRSGTLQPRPTRSRCSRPRSSAASGRSPVRIIGVLLFQWLETITRARRPALALTGAGLLVVLYRLPGGFGQLIFSVRDRYLRWVAERRGILVPSLVADKRGGRREQVDATARAR